MDIVELVVAVCLLARPDVCSEQHFPFLQDNSLYGCMVRAQPWLAQWETEHPEYVVMRWTCGYPRQDKDA